MATVSSTFTAVGVSASLRLKAIGERVTVAISGTYAQSHQLERATSPAELAWERVSPVWSTANATVAFTYFTAKKNERLRLRCISDTSGTATYSFEDGDKATGVMYDEDGTVLAYKTQAGIDFQSDMSIAGTLAVTGITTLTGGVVIGDDGTLAMSRAALAATGSDDTDAAVIVDQIVAVTGADGTKGVALPAAATTAGPILVINTNASNALKVYPVSGGDDNINGLSEDAAFTVGPAWACWFVPTSATQWYCPGAAAAAATVAQLDFVAGVTAGTAAASKALVLDANSKLDGLPLIKRSLTALSLANLQALAGTPIQVVAAPGAGKFIQVLGWRFRTIFVTTAIDDAAGDGNLILKYAAGSTIDVMEADGLVDAAATTQGISGNLTELLVAETAIDNIAIQISNDGAEYTIVGVGDSTAEVEVFYRILDTNPS